MPLFPGVSLKIAGLTARICAEKLKFWMPLVSKSSPENSRPLGLLFSNNPNYGCPHFPGVPLKIAGCCACYFLITQIVDASISRSYLKIAGLTAQICPEKLLILKSSKYFHPFYTVKNLILSFLDKSSNF